jgi:hypothetical protein
MFSLMDALPGGAGRIKKYFTIFPDFFPNFFRPSGREPRQIPAGCAILKPKQFAVATLQPGTANPEPGLDPRQPKNPPGRFPA